ncbi:MAG TPA: response regulator [Elusimicrobiales bacterium]|nr:response regulator [Elusimicrobiales bacterium]
MSRTIVLVDDERHAIDMLAVALQPLMCNIKTAVNAEDALKLAEEADVDLLITDIMMPGVKGTELFYKIKKIDPFIQVVLITGYPSLHRISEMLDAGANDFLIKPFDLSRLVQVAREALARAERWRGLRNEWVKFNRAANHSGGMLQ